MTNEEEAMDISDSWESTHDSCVAERAALQMAEWKDEQLSKAIDEVKEEYIELWTNNLDTTEETAARLTALNRLKRLLLETSL